MSLKAGDRAPDFTLPADDGGTLSLKDLAGRKIVLYFYPKDDTSGCTAEACSFRDLSPGFAEADTVVIGVSRDGVSSHDRFKSKYGLPFALLSDADATVCEAYGVWVEKSMYGRKYMGIERATFLIGRDGVIRHVWRKVKVPGHAEAVLDAAAAD